ncbi:hypothetical protein WMY93_017309 [Mugilogobius chulae]|uniref:Uncharacterized protein n=1 Tax=Mugilogobius chulae TaxID=88201 RepID=A0AAW0NST6_9GOBI
MEQYSRVNDVVISGLAIKPRSYARAAASAEVELTQPDLDSIEQQVISFLDNKGIAIDSRDIEACHLLPRRNSQAKPTVIMSLQARYSGPYVIQKKISDRDYVVTTPDRGRRSRLCRVNMLEPYYDREQLDKPSPDQGAVLALSIAPATDSPLPLSNSLQVSDSVSLSGAEDGPCAQMNNHEEMAEQMKNGEGSVCPSKRWNHAMCLIDPDTAVLIGGETSGQNYSKDPFWKLELDSDFWFPMDSFSSEHVPLCSRGHTGLSYNELYILNTLTWKWTLVKTKGSVPTLAYPSACIYKKELLFLVALNQALFLEKNFAVMPCTYSTQSLDCGIQPLCFPRNWSFLWQTDCNIP